MSEPAQTDQQLRQALTRQWTSVLPVLNAYVMTSVRDRQHAEDIVQEVGAIISAGFTEIPEGVPFNRWVLGVARNQILKRYRDGKRDRHVFQSEVLESIAGSYERLSDRTEDMRAALQACLEKLPERSRSILEMRYKQERRVNRIADLLGPNANAISGVLFRVRQAIKDCIEKQLSDGEVTS